MRLDTTRLTGAPGRLAGLGLAAMSAALWAIGGIAIVAVAATALAFSLSSASLRRITPTEFAVTSTLEPTLAAVASAVFLGVTLGAPQYAGGVLTMIAVLLLAPADPGAP